MCVRRGKDGGDLVEDCLQEHGPFLSFPYICPEPVLVKSSFFMYKWLFIKRPFSYLERADEARVGEVNDAHLPVKTVFKNGGHVIGFLSAQSIE